MRNLFLILVFFFFFYVTKSQSELVDITFEDSHVINQFIILDTSQSIWRIGYPIKSNFSTALIGNSSIVTDLYKPYPPSKRTSFILKFFPPKIDQYDALEMGGIYKINSDTLKDYGIVELSYDSGKTWINILDSNIFNCEYSFDSKPLKPVFTGNLLEKIHNFSFKFPTLPYTWIYTILFKFTFISDSFIENKDGWIIDNLWIAKWRPGDINNFDVKKNVKIVPNPNTGKFTLTSNNDLSSIEVYNLTGKLLYSDYNLKRQTSVDIDLSDLQKGIYFARIQDGKQVLTKKIIIQ